MNQSSASGRRIAVGYLSHESNSFSPIPTPLEAFEPVLRGDDVLRNGVIAFPSLRGFRDGGETDWQLRGLVAAEAMPSAPITSGAADALCRLVDTELAKLGRVDGVLFFLHGAMLCADGRSLDLEVCRVLRSRLSRTTPVVLAMDLHGNVSEDVTALVQGIVAFHTNPHIDMYERGIEAAHLLQHNLLGQRSVVEVAKPPMLLPTVNMLTDRGPMSELESLARVAEADPEIGSVAVFGGWPLADAPWAGPSVVVTGANRGAARRYALEIADLLEERREAFLVTLAPIDRALDLAGSGSGPLVLADVADNAGGGGTSDTTDVLRHLVTTGAAGSLACIWDPQLVGEVWKKQGESIQVSIGGKCAPDLFGDPVEVKAHVAAVTDGIFRAEGAVLDYGIVDCGPTVRLDIGQLHVIVTSVRHPANDRGFFRQVGIDPEDEPLLVVKSRGHFRAEFEPIASAVVEVDARGPTHPDLSRFNFTRISRPTWPLDAHPLRQTGSRTCEG
jgi:microcystin degradation protein MlrC